MPRILIRHMTGSIEVPTKVLTRVAGTVAATATTGTVIEDEHVYKGTPMWIWRP